MTGFFLQKSTDFPLNPAEIRWPNFDKNLTDFEFSQIFRFLSHPKRVSIEFYRTFQKPTGSLGHTFFGPTDFFNTATESSDSAVQPIHISMQH
jgi:hypothetical protein